MAVDVKGILDEMQGRGFRLFEEHVNPQFARVLRTIGFNRSYARAEGPYLFDSEGNRYLDFLAGWGVFNWGRGHPDIQKTLLDVLRSDFPNWVAFDTPPLAAKLAVELQKRMPNDLDMVYFCNSGTECVEAAIKFARRATGRPRLVHLSKAFHGLTTGSLSLNGDGAFRSGFEPFLPGGVEIPFNDLEALERALSGNDVAAFVLEPIQGKGVFLPDDHYLLEAQKLCRRHGTLVVCDEIQTGMGRSGKFLACEWEEGFDPDVVLLAKALSGGYVPVGAVLTRRWIYDKVYPSMSHALVHACTFGMGNLAMAAGLASLHVLDEHHLMDNANRLGALFKEGLEALKPRFQLIKEIRQRGLMIGIEFGEPRSLGLKSAWHLVHKMDRNLFCQAVVIPLFDDHRILTQVAGHNMDVVKLLPPLVISEDDVRWFLRAFEDVMVRLHRFPGPVWEVLKRLARHAIAGRSREAARSRA